jgi:hypothetical protein
MHYERLDEPAEVSRNVAIVKAPRVVSPKSGAAFDDRQAVLWAAPHQKQGQKRVLEAAAYEHVVVLLSGNHHLDRSADAPA